MQKEYIIVGEVGEEFEATVLHEKIKYSIMNIETASADVRTMDEAAKSSAVTDKHNEESAEIISKQPMLLKIWMNKPLLILKYIIIGIQ